MQLVHRPRSVKLFNKCIKGRNRYKAKLHHKIKLEYNQKKAITIKYINIIYKWVINKEDAVKSPPMQGHTRTTACLNTVDNGGRGVPGGHGGELVAEPRKTLIIDQEKGASKGILGGNLRMLLFGCRSKDTHHHIWLFSRKISGQISGHADALSGWLVAMETHSGI